MLTLVLIAVAARAAAVEVTRGPGWVWWEAEAADATDLTPDMAFKPANESEAAALSAGAWIGIGKETKTGFAEYRIAVEEDGEYIFYVRKFWTHGPFRWRIDHGPWQTVPREVALLDAQPLRQYVVANWVEAGRTRLELGPRVLRVEALEAKGTMVLDAFCLSRKPLIVRGTMKPGERVADVPGGWFAFEPEWDDFRDSPIDLRPILNEAAAGDGGFIRAEGDRFVHGATGRPVRFWAVNAGPQVAQMTRPSIDALARFLAKRGVNMVRCHGGVYQGKGRDATQVDPAKLDRLFYFVSALKKNGIYAGLSIHFQHWLDVREDPRVPGYEGSKDGRAFAIHFFDRNYQELLKYWWRSVLNTENPYTGTTLAKDPAIAYCEVLNEDNFFFYTFKPYDVVPAYYMPELEKMFGQWLTKKYGSIEKAFATWGPEKSQVKGDNLAEGRVGLYQAAMLGGASWAVNQRNAQRASDCARFLAETEREFFAMMRSCIQQDLGYAGMVCGSQMGTADHRVLTPLERWTNLDMDFLDKHGYYGGRPNRSVLRFDPRDAKGNGALPAVPFALTTYDDKPLMCTEFAWNQPNVYQGEANVLAGVLGRTIGIDGLVFFTLESSPQWDGRVSNRSWPIKVPSMAGLWPATALLYRTDLLPAGKTVLQADLGLEKLFRLEGSPVIDPKSGDDLNEPAADEKGGGRVDPRVYMVGNVNATFVPGDQHHIKDASTEYVDTGAKMLKGSNGAWTWDYGAGLFRIHADKAQGVAGFLAKAGKFDLPDLSITTPMEYGSILAVPLDGQPLRTSRRILLQVGSEAKDHSANGVSRAPILVRECAGTVAFTRPDAGSLKVTQFDCNGYPLQTSTGAQRIELSPTVLCYFIEQR